MYLCNRSQGTHIVERIVRQLPQANENLAKNVLKTILTANKVKEQIYKMDKEYNDGRIMNSSCVKTNERLKVYAVISYSDYKPIVQMFTY